jgi:T4 RnlA family RNA ligase
MFTLEEALEAIKNKPEFSHNRREGFSVIDYNLTMPGTFVGSSERETLILKNLRGTTFDGGGDITSLALDKFHNLGECEGWFEKDIVFSKKFHVLEKLDGSMIRMIRIGDGYRLGTRAGVTDYSVMAEKFLKTSPVQHRYEKLFHICMAMNATPIFEYTSRENQVVIDYPEAALTLLAIRSNENGDYCPYETLVSIAGVIPVVKQTLHSYWSLKEIAAAVKLWDDAEGVVITFDDGFRVKIKADQYCLLHRSLDTIQFEKNVLELVLNGTLDDLLPLVSADRAKRLVAYSDSVIHHVLKAEADLDNAYENITLGLSDRDYAMEAKKVQKFTKFLFNFRRGRPSGFREYLIQNCASQTTVDSIREFIGPSFKDFK